MSKDEDVQMPENYNLANLVRFDKSLLQEGNKEEASFIIALATVYNDMKDYYWLHQYLIEREPKQAENISTVKGQYNGQINFILKNLLAVFNEFIILLEKNKKCLVLPGILEAEKELDKDNLQKWIDLKNMAEGEGKSETEEKVIKVLKMVRDNVASHYYGLKNFTAGFAEYCEKVENPAVYASFGDQMQTTRFYFADASAQYRINQFLEKEGLSVKEVMDYFSKVNSSLRFLVEGYFKRKQRATFNSKRLEGPPSKNKLF